MANSRTKAENTQDEPGASYYQKVKHSKKQNNGGLSEGHRSQLKGLPLAKAGMI